MLTGIGEVVPPSFARECEQLLGRWDGARRLRIAADFERWLALVRPV